MNLPVSIETPMSRTLGGIPWDLPKTLHLLSSYSVTTVTTVSLGTRVLGPLVHSPLLPLKVDGLIAMCVYLGPEPLH